MSKLKKQVKLDLKDLKIQSFVTALTDEEKDRAKVGRRELPGFSTVNGCTACSNCSGTCC